MAQKLLLFWRKPARRCWWEGIDLENVDGIEGTLKVWIRRVWTLEMVNMRRNHLLCRTCTDFVPERHRTSLTHIHPNLSQQKRHAAHASRWPDDSCLCSTCRDDLHPPIQYISPYLRNCPYKEARVCAGEPVEIRLFLPSFFSSIH